MHKSIKYNVWSSTLNGNKLGNGYEDAKKQLKKMESVQSSYSFSVNACGQFCRVAEIVGSVDFNKDTDFE